MNLYYQEHTPSPLLRPYVLSYWSLATDGKDEELSAMQRCFPAGTIEWIIQIRGKNMRGHKEGNCFHYPASIFTGICNRANEWQSYGNAALLGVRFTPEAAIALFNAPLKEYPNSFINTEDFLGSSISPILSRIMSAATTAEQLSLMESFLLSKIRDIEMERNYFTEAMKLIRQYDQLNIADLSKKVFVGERQLQRSFQNLLGITPKAYHKVMRLYKAHQSGLIQQDNFTNIAYRMGYADPAHFTRDFKNYFGVPPEHHFSSINMKWVA